jgi:hypothetical protein
MDMYVQCHTNGRGKLKKGVGKRKKGKKLYCDKIGKNTIAFYQITMYDLKYIKLLFKVCNVIDSLSTLVFLTVSITRRLITT